MAQTMSRPAVFLVVTSLPQENRFTMLGPEEKCVTFRRNGQTMDLSLFSRSGVVVVILDLQDRTRDYIRVVRVKGFEFLYDFVYLIPTERIYDLSAIFDGGFSYFATNRTPF